jgi:hypothetical protein
MKEDLNNRHADTHGSTDNCLKVETHMIRKKEISDYVSMVINYATRS